MVAKRGSVADLGLPNLQAPWHSIAMACFVLHAERPVSFNNKPGKRKFEERLKRAATARYAAVPYAAGIALYSRVYYFHNGPREIDADNISKPVLDALRGVLYGDDRQVVWRVAAKVDMSGVFTLRTDRIEPAAFEEISRIVSSRPDVLVVEVGELDTIAVSFGSES